MTRYFCTDKLEVLETVRRAMEHGIDMHITDCSGDEFGCWIDLDLWNLSKKEENYVIEFAEKEQA